jgi:hypothetical protein
MFAFGIRLNQFTRSSAPLVVTTGSFDSDRRLGARLTSTTGGVVAVRVRVRVVQRVTGVFRTAAHTMGVVFERIGRALVSDTVMSQMWWTVPGDAGSSTFAVVYCDGDGI